MTALQLSRNEMQDRILSYILDEMIKTEGYRKKVYKDSEGHLTVGIGHLVLPEDNLELGDMISDDQVHAFFAKDILPAINAAMDQAIDIGEFEEDFVLALTQVNYQLGINWPKSWPNTYRELLAGNWDAVINAVSTSLWAKQTPARTDAFILALETERDEQLEKEINMADSKDETKPGIKTTEFWLGVITYIISVIVMIVNEALGLGLDVADIVASTIPVLTYILSRMGVKMFKDTPKADIEAAVNAALLKQSESLKR